MYTDPRGGHNRKTVNKDFFKKWSPKMAYVTGLIYADGAVEDVRKSSRTCYTTIASKDKELLVDVCQAMESNHNIYIYKGAIREFPGGKRYLTKSINVLRIGSKSIFQDLLNIGVTPRKSLTLQFPKVPQRFLKYFVRGYFDGDGCVNVSLKKNRLKPVIITIFTCGSEKFLVTLSKIVGKVIDMSTQKINFQSRAFRLRYRMHDSLKLLKFMYKGLNDAPFLKRKYDIYQKYLLTTQI